MSENEINETKAIEKAVMQSLLCFSEILNLALSVVPKYHSYISDVRLHFVEDIASYDEVVDYRQSSAEFIDNVNLKLESIDKELKSISSFYDKNINKNETKYLEEFIIYIYTNLKSFTYDHPMPLKAHKYIKDPNCDKDYIPPTDIVVEINIDLILEIVNFLSNPFDIQKEKE